jgi:hypothetical protein
MLGHQSPVAQIVQDLFNECSLATACDPLLNQKVVPPPLLFVDPIAVSGGLNDRGVYVDDEFAIFQVGYKDAPVEISDLKQRMIINAPHITNKRRLALKRLAMVSETTGIHLLQVLTKNIDLFSTLHTEGHNRGHFVGAWAYEDKVKKNCILYEAVEEFRACIASIMLVEHMNLTEEQKDAFALSVFLTRFLTYGFDAFGLTAHRRETVREITVGLFFFEWLRSEKLVEVIEGNKPLVVEWGEVRGSLIRAYQKINSAESLLEVGDDAGLRTIAREWYTIAFHNRQYSSEAKVIYNQIAVSERSS